tara:strand:+ start:301 stop:777 length:477 start_codon:yes stop_codon:yes gene_type:complete
MSLTLNANITGPTSKWEEVPVGTYQGVIVDLEALDPVDGKPKGVLRMTFELDKKGANGQHMTIRRSFHKVLDNEKAALRIFLKRVLRIKPEGEFDLEKELLGKALTVEVAEFKTDDGMKSYVDTDLSAGPQGDGFKPTGDYVRQADRKKDTDDDDVPF